MVIFFFFSSRRRHTRWPRDWSSDVCSSDLSGTTTPRGNVARPTAPPGREMTTKVEIVDDHFLFADALGSVIRGLDGYEVAGIAQSGAQAISIARTTRPDVILLDYHLPGYDAADLIPRLRALAPGVRIVVLTSDTSDATLVRGLRAGVEGYI